MLYYVLWIRDGRMDWHIKSKCKKKKNRQIKIIKVPAIIGKVKCLLRFRSNRK